MPATDESKPADDDGETSGATTPSNAESEASSDEELEGEPTQCDNSAEATAEPKPCDGGGEVRGASMPSNDEDEPKPADNS